MKKLLILLLMIASLSANAQWNTIYTFPFNAKDMSFVSRDTGFVCGWENNTPELFRTVTGGYTWEEITWNFTDVLTSVYFLNSRKGFIGNYGSQILMTEDGGATWTEKFSNGPPVWVITFASPSTGYAFLSIMEYFVIVKTTDGGDHWNQVDSFTAPEPGFGATDAFFTDEQTGYMTTYQGYIYKTTDGGYNWNIILNSNAYSWSGVYFTDANTGYVTGEPLFDNSYGMLLKTVNAGASWDQTEFPYPVMDVVFTNSDTGYVASNGINKTTDSGNTWNIDSCDIEFLTPEKLQFADPEICYGLIGSDYGSYLMKRDPDVAVGIADLNKENSFRVFPVPADKSLSVVSDMDLENCRIELTDLSGKTIPVKLCSDRTKLKVLDVGGICDGIYLLKIYTESFAASEKIIIKH